MSAIAGWIAMISILLAYWLISSKKVNGQSILYQALNLVGAIGFIWNCTVQGAWPVVALNIIWAIIAIWALAQNKKEEK